MIKKIETSSLRKQTTALGNYLDDMLFDATELASGAVDQSFDLEPRENALLVEVAIEQVPTEADHFAQPDTTEKNDTSSDIKISNGQLTETESGQGKDKPANQLELSQFPIQCLMFRVGGNLLSLPLKELNGVVPWTDELTRLPQSPDWMFGLLKHRGSNPGVLDSSKVLGIPAIAGTRPGHILLLAGYEWAISCDILEDVVTLEYNDIQWHRDNFNAVKYGTIRKTLAYLLSPSGIVGSLNLANELSSVEVLNREELI